MDCDLIFQLEKLSIAETPIIAETLKMAEWEHLS